MQMTAIGKVRKNFMAKSVQQQDGSQRMVAVCRLRHTARPMPQATCRVNEAPCEKEEARPAESTGRAHARTAQVETGAARSIFYGTSWSYGWSGTHRALHKAGSRMPPLSSQNHSRC